MKMIVQQAVAVKFERLALLKLGQRCQKGLEVSRFVKYILPIVATIDHVVDQAVVNRSQGARHGSKASGSAATSQLNSSDPFSGPVDSFSGPNVLVRR